jgi:ArsR family transcriptional regulator
MKRAARPSANLPILADCLKVLADPTRLAVLDLLMQGLQCNCFLGDQLGLTMNLISHHLKVLREANLVDVEHDPLDARWMYYSVNQKELAELREQLSAFLDPQRIQPRLPTCGPQFVGAESVRVTSR